MNQESPLAIYSVDLSPLLAEICQLIGWTAALVLVEKYGGTTLFVPAEFNADLPLVELLGQEPAKNLIARYGGTKIYIARMAQAIRTARNLIISDRLSNDEPAYMLALEYRLSERQIWRIVKNPNTLRDTQPDLFSSK